MGWRKSTQIKGLAVPVPRHAMYEVSMIHGVIKHWTSSHNITHAKQMRIRDCSQVILQDDLPLLQSHALCVHHNDIGVSWEAGNFCRMLVSH